MRRSLLARLSFLIVLGILPCLLADSSGLAARRDRGSKVSDEKKIDSLIDDLKSDRFETREAAMRSLMDFDDEPPALRKAAKSADLEVRRRVAQILQSFARKRARRGLARVRVLAKEGRVDEMIDRLVLWKDSDKGKGWKALVELAARLAEGADRTYGKTHFKQRIKPIKMDPAREAVVPKNLADYWQATLKLATGDNIALDSRRGREPYKLIIASGDVHTVTSHHGIIAAGGNARLSSTHASVIICDGDCLIEGEIDDSLIIARGKVTCPRTVNRSVILSENFIVIPERLQLYQTVLSNGGPNGLVRFFNPGEVGLSIGDVLDQSGKLVPEGGAWIHKVHEGTPFSSKLRAEDVITAIDGVKTPSRQIFRKVLRRKLAEGGPIMTFTVQRASKTLEVPIPVKD
jgi:hypothetical protein